MSKMKQPTLEVIHFKENDIIIASGGTYKRSAFLSGWGDSVDNNAKITFTGEKERTYNWDILHDQAQEGMLSNLTFIKDNDFIVLYELAMDENKSDKWNGRYEKDDNDNWHWRGCQ